MAETRGYGFHALGTWGFPLSLWLGVSGMHFFDFILVEFLGSALFGLFVLCLFLIFPFLFILATALVGPCLFEGLRSAEPRGWLLVCGFLVCLVTLVICYTETHYDF